MSALSAQRLQLILSYLDAAEAFGSARVCRNFASTVETAIDAAEFLQRIRPTTWNGAFPKELDQEFCRRLLRDWHFCLKNSTCQVGYVAYDQHLIFVEPSSKLAPSPQGADPFPVSVDAKTYKCSIEEFHWDSLWWKCLDNELFHWPKETMRDDYKQAMANPLSKEEADLLLSADDLVPAGNQDRVIVQRVQPVMEDVPIELEPVFGYRGDMSLPKLSEDVLAVLALNAAWFQYSFWTRQLQGILLLRDGRFLLIGSCEMQGTIDSQLCARVYRCFVSDSLMSLVTFAQDPRSREILRTRVPGEMEQERASPNLNAALQEVKVPRIDYEDKAILEETFGEFKKASKESEGVLFNTSLVDQEELRANIKVGDLVRVKREGDTFVWISCQCKDSPIPQGPVAPDVEEDFVQSSQSQDLRWMSFSGGCHLGLRDGRFYQAKVVRVMDNGLRVDVQYLDPTEWANGNSGFTNSLGNDRHDSYIEADVDILRCKVLPTSSWYWSFKEVWDRCGSFSSLNCDFGGERSNGGSVRAFSSGPSGYPSKAGAPEAPAPAFRKLGDVFADTLPAHDFRCRLLSEEKDMLPEDQGMIEELSASKENGSDCFPRQKTMVWGKALVLKLLRVPTFWKKWMEQGGESPSNMTTLFKKEKFVRLVIQ